MAKGVIRHFKKQVTVGKYQIIEKDISKPILYPGSN
jgi:hypothetical protein